MFDIFAFRFRLCCQINLWRIKRLQLFFLTVAVILAVGFQLLETINHPALASKDSTNPGAVISQQSSEVVNKTIGNTKLKPRSRNQKSSTNILQNSVITPEPLVMPAGNITVEIPILIYHKTPVDFEGHLQNLQAKGYNTISMRTASRILRGVEGPPPKPAVITFDDGFSDQLVAFELLKKYQMKATFYVMPGGQVSNWCLGAESNRTDCGDSYLNWTQVRELSNSGLIEIGSHTLDHADLRQLDPQSQRTQIFESKSLLESKIGKEVSSFAYPYGGLDNQISALVQEAGYTSAVSTISDSVQSTEILFSLHRVRDPYLLP